MISIDNFPFSFVNRDIFRITCNLYLNIKSSHLFTERFRLQKETGITIILFLDINSVPCLSCLL